MERASAQVTQPRAKMCTREVGELSGLLFGGLGQVLGKAHGRQVAWRRGPWDVAMETAPGTLLWFQGEAPVAAAPPPSGGENPNRVRLLLSLERKTLYHVRVLNAHARERAQWQFQCIYCDKVLEQLMSVHSHVLSQHPDMYKKVKVSRVGGARFGWLGLVHVSVER